MFCSRLLQVRYCALLLCLGLLLPGVYAGEPEAASNPTPVKPAIKIAPAKAAAASESRVIATLFGEPITTDSTRKVGIGFTLTGDSIIAYTLFERYAQERGITVSDAEVAAHLAHMHEQMKRMVKGGRVEQIPPERLTPGADEVMRLFILRAKIGQQLYRDYGGRIICQQAGPEPLDAMRDFLKAEQAKGSFHFCDAEAEAAFWFYYTAMPHIYATDEKEIQRLMTTQWWVGGAPSFDE